MPETMEDVLKVSIENKICLLTLNRPERRNALSKTLIRALTEAILAADYNPEVSLIAITGVGDKAFCAGVDLKDARDGDERGEAFGGPLHSAERAFTEIMLDSRKPSMAIINGPAIAGGCELALVCDLRIMSEDAHFGLPEAKRGMGAHFASVILPQMVPMAIAMEWLYTGRRITIDEVERWGLVNRVVPPAKLMDTAMELAGDIINSAPLSLQRMKQTFRKTYGMPLHAGIRLEAGPDPYSSEDRKEGARAYLERRPPIWKGK